MGAVRSAALIGENHNLVPRWGVRNFPNRYAWQRIRSSKRHTGVVPVQGSPRKRLELLCVSYPSCLLASKVLLLVGSRQRRRRHPE